MTCVFSFGGDTTVRTRRGSATSVRGHFCSGLRTHPVTLHPAGVVEYVALTLKPPALPALFGIHARALVDAFADLSALSTLLTDLADRIGENVQPAADRATAVRDALRPVFAVAQRSPPRALERAIERIDEVGGVVRIRDVCDEIGITTRQLEREFDRWIGVSAKFYARIARMNTALGLLRGAADEVDLADLAVSAGYYDQSHLCNEFSDLVGRSPRAIMRSSVPA